MTANIQRLRDRIAHNISAHGFHIHVVMAAVVPRYAYTVGLTALSLPELVLPGALLFAGDDVVRAINLIARGLRAGESPTSPFSVEGLGAFSLRPVSPQWADALMLGVADHYPEMKRSALQVLPEASHWTRDIPDLAAADGPKGDPVWRWLAEEWPHEAPPRSTVTTNVMMLQGAPVTEVARWEQDVWEAFAGPGPDVQKEDMRVIPIGTALGIDSSLRRILALDVGDGIWREDSSDEWHIWRSK